MGPGQPSIVVQPGTKGGGLSEYRSPTRNQHRNPTTSIVIQPGTNTFLRFGRRLRCFCFHKARGLLFLSEARASLPSHTPTLLLLHNKLSPPFLYKVHSFSVRDKTSFPSHRPGLPFPQRRSAFWFPRRDTSFTVRDKTPFPSHRPSLPFPQRRNAFCPARDRREVPSNCGHPRASAPHPQTIRTSYP